MGNKCILNFCLKFSLSLIGADQSLEYSACSISSLLSNISNTSFEFSYYDCITDQAGNICSNKCCVNTLGTDQCTYK